MPLVEITYAPDISDAVLRELGKELPHIVSVAVQRPEEPYDGDLRPGDVQIRFRSLGPFDRSGLDAVIEVRSRYFESRAANRQQRGDLLHRLVAEATGLADFGVYLTLPVAAWAQTD